MHYTRMSRRSLAVIPKKGSLCQSYRDRLCELEVEVVKYLLVREIVLLEFRNILVVCKGEILCFGNGVSHWDTVSG